jgi:hypothetical protein
MTYIVEMLRLKESGITPAEHRCHGDSWNKFIAIAQTFGWSAKGSEPDEDSDEYMEYFKPTYKPEQWGHQKIVSSVDALEMSKALKRALDEITTGKISLIPFSRTTLISDFLDDAESLEITDDFLAQMKRFEEFARGGGFVFAWDD